MTQDGALRWCEECAWEDPNNPKEAPPPREEKQPMETIDSIGTKKLAQMCQARVTELEEVLVEAERKYREQTAAAKTEIARLRKIIAFCGAPEPKRAAAATAVPREPGDSRNAWTCPDCGHRTVSRWVQRHKDQECPKRATA